MNTNSFVTRSAVTGALSSRRLLPVPAFSAAVPSRTALPVLSNHAFIAAWAARRSRIIAAARTAKFN